MSSFAVADMEGKTAAAPDVVVAQPGNVENKVRPISLPYRVADTVSGYPSDDAAFVAGYEAGAQPAGPQNFPPGGPELKRVRLGAAARKQKPAPLSYA